MSTEQEHAEQVPDESALPVVPAPPEPPAEPADRRPSWWHRDHPTFTALAGFFTGLVSVILVPGLFIALLGLVFESHTAEDLFPFVLVTLAIPVGLLVPRHTRRFGFYMLIGIVTTAIVVGGVAAVVLWYLVDHQG